MRPDEVEKIRTQLREYRQAAEASFAQAQANLGAAKALERLLIEDESERAQRESQENAEGAVNPQ